jgi:flagellar hook-basal body complex protein FliE
MTMKDVTIQSRLRSLGIESPPQKTESTSGNKTEGPSFNDVLKKAIEDVDGLEKEADQAVQDLVSGGETNLHEAMIALQKADVSFKVLMEVRDKIVSAYKEIMRMQA